MTSERLAHILSALWLLVTALVLFGCGSGGGGGTPVGAAVAPYTVSGKVTADGGASLGAVTLTITGGGVEYSDGSGNYSFTHLPNGTYTIVPSRSGYTFTPASRTVTINNDGQAADFTASALPTYAIAGKVTGGNGAGLAGTVVTVAAGGIAVGTKVTDGGGNYALSGLREGNYQVTVSHVNGYAFTPASRSVSVAGADTTADFLAASVSTYAVSGRVATDSAGLANVALTLYQPDTGATYRAATGANGNYSLSGIPEGYYMLTPELAGYNFQPYPRLVHLSGADLAGQDIAAASATSGGGQVNVTF